MTEGSLEFWNQRASLGEKAGTNDLIAKRLEMEALLRHVRPGQRVLDVGCGNGLTAFHLADQLGVTVAGVDFSPEMVAEANRLKAEHPRAKDFSFQVMDVRDIASIGERFDVVITERVLINLPDWPSQKKAINDLVKLLNPGGRYLMCENYSEAVANLNSLRARLQLPEIVPPWHNRYLVEAELREVDGAALVGEDDFASAYYFLSRVVNAWVAAKEGAQPDYDSPINQLALQDVDFSPQVRFGGIGQTKLWIWQKSGFGE